MISRFLIAFAAFATATAPLFADPFDDFKKNVAQEFLKPFAKDIGAVMGGGSFHTGRSLGFPGVDIGGHVTVQNKPSEDNKILKNAKVDAFGLPFLQGEVGLPFNVDVILRGISLQDITVVGGGLRYGLFKLRMVPLSPGLAVSVFGHALNHTAFSVAHQSANIALDLSVPIVSPYIGFGMDRTRVKVNQADVAGVVGLDAKATGTRFAAGVNLKPLPLVYLHGAVLSANSKTGFEAGLGVKF
ncbi:MAG: hypothetical protein HYT79_12075 [Elusimicrobia bacterium]|nr:hypothetical protein [Elusimicrobiota bacterium]